MFVKICALSVLCSCACLLLMHIGASFSFAVKLASTTLVGGALVIMVEPMIDRIFSYSASFEGISECAGVVIRALGIAMLARLCSDVCNDLGERTLASGVELAAKFEIFLLCLPFIDKIIECAVEILSM